MGDDEIVQLFFTFEFRIFFFVCSKFMYLGVLSEIRRNEMIVSVIV